jgi:ribose transport system permease protein
MSERFTQLAPPGSVDVGMRVALAAAVFVGFGIFVPGFATTSNMYAVLETTVPVGLVAVGVGAVILAGELDLSVGAVATCAGILLIRFVDIGVFPAVLITVLAGAVYGVVQGVIIAKVSVPSVVFTLGSLIAVGGVAFILSGEQVVTLPLDQLGIASDIRTRIWIFSPASLTMLAVTIVVGLLLGYTRIGREVYALGGAREESRAAGVAQVRPIVLVFALAGALAALAGTLASLRSGSAGPRAYETLLFGAVTGVLVGGVSLYGGRGRVLGMFVGVLTLQFLLSALALLSAPFWAADLATGGLLLSFLVVELAHERSPARSAIERFLLARRRRATAHST